MPQPEEAPPKCRYERAILGELLHPSGHQETGVFLSPGHRVAGGVRKYSKKPSYQALYVAIDGHSRVGFILMLADETVKGAIAFVFAALRYYQALWPTYRSKKFAKLLRRLKIKHVRTRPYTPRTNGKAEYFIQTLLREWAYEFTYPNSAAGSHEQPFWMTHYNFHRPHSATDNLPPASRLGFIANTIVRSYS